MSYFDDKNVNLQALRKKAFNLRWAEVDDGVIPLTAADPDFPCSDKKRPKQPLKAITVFLVHMLFPGHRSRAAEGILRPLSRRSALAYSALHFLRPEYISILSAAGVSA